MKILSKLTPAETILLTDSAIDLKQMIKNTFIDLLLKNVIAIKIEERKVIEQDENRGKVEVVKTTKFIIAGKNFVNYSPKKHESFFLPKFNNPSDFKILYHHFVMMAYENIGGIMSFKKAVLKSKNLDGLLKSNFIQHIFGRYSFTKAGRKTQDEILEYLKSVDSKIKELVQNDQSKALVILLGMGGNILFLRNVDFDFVNEIDSQVWKKHKKRFFSSSDGDSDDYSDIDLEFYFDEYDSLVEFEGGFKEFDTIIDSLNIEESDSFFSFDDYFDGDNNDADGCSSCSGCGGCGGCD